jgi:hypothetical protein
MTKTSLRRVLFLIAFGWSLAAGGSVAQAHADPACNAPGLPPCAGPGDPNVVCAIIAWRTWTPCNYWGIKVPEGTPGSLG